MARLRPTLDHGVAQQTFEAVDDSGAVIAKGTLEVEIIPGAQRHSGVAFVASTPTPEADDGIDRLVRAGG